MDESHQFTSSEGECAFVLMGGHFIILGFVITAIFVEVAMHGVGGFAEVIAKKDVAGAGHEGIIGFEVPGLMPTPGEAGVLGESSLIAELGNIANFGEDSGSEDGTDAGNGKQGKILRVGNPLDLIKNGTIDGFEFLAKAGDAIQARGQSNIEGIVGGSVEAETGLGGFLEKIGGMQGIVEAILGHANEKRGKIL